MFKRSYRYWFLISYFLFSVNQLYAEPSKTINKTSDKIYKSPGIQIGLDFPYANSDVLSYVKCFGLTLWDDKGEIHGGIDLIPEYDLNYSDATSIRDRLVEIIAPSAGRVIMARSVPSTDDGMEDNMDFILIIEITPRWDIVLVIEPKIDTSKAPSWVDRQTKLIKVKEGQRVKQGARLGYLVVGGEGDAYPHVHYSLLYRRVPDDPNAAYPEETLNNILENARYQYPRNIVLNNPRAPWDNIALDQTIAAAFFCPYEFSTASAQAIFDNIPKHDLAGINCTCVRLRHSVDGNCGECTPPSSAPVELQPPGNLRITQ
jgi:hypothetical protein